MADITPGGASSGSSQYTYTGTYQGDPNAADGQSTAIGKYDFLANNSAGEIVVNLNSVNVLPVFGHSETTTISTAPGTSQTFDVTLSNLADSASDIAAGDAAAIDILSLSLVGPDASDFSLGTLTASQLLAGGSGELPVTFTPQGPGTYMLEIDVQTDLHAALNTDGVGFELDFTANSVPEPTSLSLLAVASLLSTRRRRR